MVNQLMDRCLAVLDVEPTTAVCPPRLTGTDAWIGHGTTLRMLEPDGTEGPSDVSQSRPTGSERNCLW
jgi:hypothetical protein